MENSKYYFAYGSNINHVQMKSRCPNAEVFCGDILKNYELKFQKYANIVPKENAQTQVLIWKINADDERKLDAFEGVPNSYIKRNFEVNGIKGFAYIMTKNIPEILPDRKYIHTIIDGYKQNNFDILPLKNAYDSAQIAEETRPRIYAAYGANLNQKDMKFRCPDAKIVNIGEITDYALQFKGCATIEPFANEKTPILIWKISRQDELNLDRFESFPHFYRKEYFNLDDSNTPIMAYIMNGNSPLSRPSQLYFDSILQGYKEAGLDETKLYEAFDRSLKMEQNQDFGEITLF